MSLWIDIKYAKLIGSRLRNFKIKKNQPDTLINFSCAFCGDSAKDKTKARAYLYSSKGKLKFCCHNCQIPRSFAAMLNHIDPILYNEYVMENFKEVHGDVVEKEIIDTDFFKTKPLLVHSNETLKHFQKAIDVPVASEYLEYRKIPVDKWNLFYYTETFKKTSNDIKPDTFQSLAYDHPRLIIPFFDADGKVFAFQGRAFGNESPKYLTVKIDDDAEKIFGLERLDVSKPVFVLEGPIDSVFLDNCIAVGGSAIDIPFLETIPDKIIIPDNEPRNEVVNKLIEKYIIKGLKIVFFPDTIVDKDINSMVMNGIEPERLEEIILENVYQGFRARLKFSSWKR